MVKLQHDGLEIILTNDEHKKLLARFNINNFRKMSGDSPYFLNPRPCILCKKYSIRGTSKCGICPFDQFRNQAAALCLGCMSVLSDIALNVAEDGPMPYHVVRCSIRPHKARVSFHKSDKEAAVVMLKAVCDFLKSGIKVNRWTLREEK